MPLAKACQQTGGVNSTTYKPGAFIHHFEKLRFTFFVNARNVYQIDYARLVDTITLRRAPARGQFVNVLSGKSALQNPGLRVGSTFNCDTQRSVFPFVFHIAHASPLFINKQTCCQTLPPCMVDASY
jgi:hypothetical protein